MIKTLLLLLFISVICTASVVPDYNITKIKSFPITVNGLQYGNPAIMDIGPDKKLYVGLAGNILNPFSDAPKGIFRINSVYDIELVVEFPSFGGFIEKILFHPDGHLYVVIANYYIPNGIVTNGIVKVDVINKTFTQFWDSTGKLIFPAGLALDSNDNLYVSGPNLGQLYKVDVNGNDELWNNNTLLQGYPSTFPVGVNGIVIDTTNQNQNVLYGMNFEKGYLVEIKFELDGSAGTPVVVLENPILISMDQLSFDPKEKFIFTAGFGTGIVARINIKNKNNLKLNILTLSSDGLGGTVQALPVSGFSNIGNPDDLFVPNLDPSNLGGGDIYLLSHD